MDNITTLATDENKSRINEIEDNIESDSAKPSILVSHRGSEIDPRIGRISKLTNQLKSLQELADFFFCYSWMFDKTSSVVYWQNMFLTITSIALSVLTANSQFLAFNCSTDTYITTITGSILYLVAFLIALNHFLELPMQYNEYKKWASVCLNDHYAIRNWMISTNMVKESYIEFSARMTTDFVNMTKQAKPISWIAKRGLIREFSSTKLHFPPVVGHIEGRNTQAVDLTSIIQELSKNLEDIPDLSSRRPTSAPSSRRRKSSYTPKKSEMLVIDLAKDKKKHSETDSTDTSSTTELEESNPELDYQLSRLRNRI